MKVNNSFSYVLITFLVFNVFRSSAQDIRGGLIFGINAAQVAGDNLPGFNKPGLNTGLTAELPFSPYHLVLRMDLLFSQKGAAPYLFSDPDDQMATAVTPYSLTLNYLEVPVVVDYVYMRHYGIGGGFSLGKLVGGNYVYNGYEYPVPIGTSEQYGDYQPWDVNAILDLLYIFKGDHWMINFRWMYSMRYIAKNPRGGTSSIVNQQSAYSNNGQSLYPTSPSPFYNYGEFNNVLAFRLIYVFGNQTKY
jgi:hypothetical protein